MTNALSIKIDKNALGTVVDLGIDLVVGTAFTFIKPTWAVTAKHVVVDRQTGTWRPGLELRFLEGKAKARGLFAHPEIDLAVLEVQESPCKLPLFPAHQSFTAASGLIVAGYSPKKTAETGSPSIFLNYIPKYELGSRERSSGVEETLSFSAAYSERGNSGGPILGEGGGVVGTVIENFAADTMLRATSILPVIERLEFRLSDN